MDLIKRRASSVAVVGVALAMAGTLAAVSYGSDTRSQVEVTELVTKGCEVAATCDSFPLDDAESGSVTATNVPVVDVDGKPAGRMRCWCTVVRGVGWHCNVIASISPGSHTERGAITASGIFRPLSDKGEVNTYAITGGTGRYVGATGFATEGWDRKRKAFVLTLHLTPA